MPAASLIWQPARMPSGSRFSSATTRMRPRCHQAMQSWIVSGILSEGQLGQMPHGV